MDSCAHCGVQAPLGAELQRCSRCKQAAYCGAACQRAAWKGHKKGCAEFSVVALLPLRDVYRQVQAAEAAGNFHEILRWEGRLEEMLEVQGAGFRGDQGRQGILCTFVRAHQMATEMSPMAAAPHALKLVRLEERRVELLGKLERFRDQAEAMCGVAQNLLVSPKPQTLNPNP